MLKNIKIYSVVALATLVILGCGSDSDKKSDVIDFVEKNSEIVTMEKLRSLGNDNNISQFTDSGVSRSAVKFSDKNANFDEECINIDENEETSIFSANNCVDGDTSFNGQVKMSRDENDATFEILQDVTAADDVFSFFAKKGSFIKMTNEQGKMTFTANFQTTIDNEEFSANNLKIIISENKANNGGSFHIQTGKVNVGELYFEVDPDTTPIVVNSDGLVSGVIKLTDGSGQKMEMEVASKDILKFKIDEDRDGKFSDSEITEENVEDFFNELGSEIDSI